ncbi:NRDE family protein [Undibacterium sp. Jales W-56]|uniref:NRDE family protein n=1 Tax=Undibacterium sp. Jales W-56 TaxID=2897325 RepID=UPI0021CDF730|nr:NRDE family protein [Undibacterium sp. Jales W-56]MCU6433389.1 NRDE family protein [Undibacterium sp. Jales W-56]
MCLIVFAWKLLPHTPLVVASNRDEFYDRPAAPAIWWENSPHVFGGRDLQSGGTWMGVASQDDQNAAAKKFAAITNVRAPSEKKTDAPSRGKLVADYLTGSLSAQEYIASIKDKVDDYNGFNLLVGDDHDLIWFSNRKQDDPRNGQALPPGIYGISNAALDTPWPKVVKTKAEFASLLCQRAPEEAYFEMLSNTTPAPDCRLPDTGVSFEMERLLSAACIESPDYGTRVSSLVRIHSHHPAEFHEKVLR